MSLNNIEDVFKNIKGLWTALHKLTASTPSSDTKITQLTTQYDKTNSNPASVLLDTTVTGSTYDLEAVLFITCGATGGFLLLLDGVTSVSNCRVSSINSSGIPPTTVTDKSQTIYNMSGTALTAAMFVVKGSFTATVGGTFYISFSQKTTNATASSILVGSTLKLTRKIL